MYNMQWLIETQKTQPQKYLYFWGHQPSKDGSITATCFSQWWISPFETEGKIYLTAEHWMMEKKALLFDDFEIAQQILLVKTPAEAKKLGRKVKNFSEEKWLEKRFELVVEGNIQKFSQHEDLKKFLLTTGNRVIVEASPVDAIWGIGLAASDSRSQNPETWRGLNLLGFALMEVRDHLNNF
jgi:ribA/ribD-fused uncharacterized protein